MPLHGIFSVLLLILIIVGIVVLVRSLFGGSGRAAHSSACSPGLDVLEERYAKGEIQRDEYQQKRRDLGG